jgi:replication-associated recombination protein RarA
LISGPPGLGKTTLAHIIAKRAGYNFIEMNARYVFIRKIILRIM